MSKKYSASGNLPANYDITISSPFDTRFVVTDKNSLIQPSTWGEYDEDTEEWHIYLYDGIIVSVVDDTNLENNGVYYLQKSIDYTNISSWKKISEQLPETSSLDSSKKYKLNFDNGELKWKEDTGGSGKSGITSEGIYVPTYTRNPETGEIEVEYRTDNQDTSILTNQYWKAGTLTTADVITVKNNPKTSGVERDDFHLEINPDLKLILFGGNAQSQERVILTMPTTKSGNSSDFIEGYHFGVPTLYENNEINTNPEDALVHWYSDESCTQEIQTTPAEEYDSRLYIENTGITSETSITLYAIAKKDDYLPSYKHKIIFTLTPSTWKIETFGQLTSIGGQISVNEN